MRSRRPHWGRKASYCPEAGARPGGGESEHDPRAGRPRLRLSEHGATREPRRDTTPARSDQTAAIQSVSLSEPITSTAESGRTRSKRTASTSPAPVAEGARTPSSPRSCAASPTAWQGIALSLCTRLGSRPTVSIAASVRRSSTASSLTRNSCRSRGRKSSGCRPWRAAARRNSRLTVSRSSPR